MAIVWCQAWGIMWMMDLKGFCFKVLVELWQW